MEIDLVQLNVWLDYGFIALYIVVVLGLSAHLVGNLLTGRLKKRFIKWEWPHHEGQPIPFLPRFLHFQHVVAMIVLVISGLYIRFPGFLVGYMADARTFMRWAHYIAMIIVVINLVWRLWYAFASARRDYREFVITRRDIVNMPKVILYYTFIKSSKPHLDKYNVMQKATYTLFVPLLILQAYTGFALVTTPLIAGTSPRDWLVGWWLGAILGSTDLAGWYMRILHYIINWLFIILTTVHVYLSVSEDFPAFLNFFGLSFLDRKHPPHDSSGHDGGHGHGGHEHDHHPEGTGDSGHGHDSGDAKPALT
ncbi:MAG: cytochrome b/b6 domain-containing protein [Actinobacteria bacterium]|nr:cytochrome b/b6 domain-containing protein [Actinomycetota bacterium]